ncbi:hypothetical protein ABIA40_000426 [Bradyrhizobium sp. USDA 223]
MPASSRLADTKIFGAHLPRTTGLQLVADARPLREASVACFLYRADMHKNIRSLIFRLNEPIPLSWIEPLHNTHRHCIISKKLNALDLSNSFGAFKGQA